MKQKASFSVSVFNPHVGGLCNINMLSLQTQGRQVVCSQRRIISLFYLLGFMVFGPFLAFMVMKEPDKIKDIPWFIAVPLGVFLLIANAGLLVGAFRQPKIVLDKNTGQISLYTSFGSGPQRVFQRGDIEKFVIGERTYHSNGYSCTNYTLSLVTRSGDTVMLCCTVNQDLLDTFKTDLLTYTGAPLESQVETNPV